MRKDSPEGPNPGYPSMLYLSRVIGVIAAPGALRSGWADGRRQAKVHSAPLSPVSGLVLYVSGAPGLQEGGCPRGVGSAVTLALTIGPMGPVVGQRVMSHDVLQLRVLRVFLREVLRSGGVGTGHTGRCESGLIWRIKGMEKRSKKRIDHLVVRYKTLCMSLQKITMVTMVNHL